MNRKVIEFVKADYGQSYFRIASAQEEEKEQETERPKTCKYNHFPVNKPVTRLRSKQCNQINLTFQKTNQYL